MLFFVCILGWTTLLFLNSWVHRDIFRAAAQKEGLEWFSVFVFSVNEGRGHAQVFRV